MTFEIAERQKTKRFLTQPYRVDRRYAATMAGVRPSLHWSKEPNTPIQISRSKKPTMSVGPQQRQKLRVVYVRLTIYFHAGVLK
jgi:hypothetical protein